MIQSAAGANGVHPAVRTLLLLLALAGIVLFTIPLFANIRNIGNLFGLCCSVLLLAFVLFHRPICGMINRIRAHAAGRITLRVLGLLVLLGLLYCLIMSIVMLHAAHKKPQQTPQAIIVLGCKVRGTAPSRMLGRRIRAAYEKLEADPSLIAVVSGGKGDNEDISEAQCMYNELTRMGIESGRIIMEDQSTSTSENLRFSKKLLDENGISGTLYIATDGYHELRAQLLAKKEGLNDCAPAAAYTSWYLLPTYWVREWFGLAHAFVFGN
ncbi:MAG: YdcF family protein [Oscillospiraceae bacterium]|nr:YdcF family protein [Oscillospiraceae bacterium]